MGPAILAALCLWSCVLTVTPLNEEEVGRATDYVEKNIFKKLGEQYAYFVKFTDDECNKGLQTQDIKVALKVDSSADIRGEVKKKEIYEGTRMVAASYIKIGNINIHSEYRLLNIPSGSTDSPISRLLKKTPDAGCVVFFSLNSPCVKTCTDPKGRYNIIDKLKQVTLPANKNRAFAYRNVFYIDKERPKKEVWDNWKELNAEIQLLRCSGNNCMKCFNNGIENDNCLD